MIEQYRLARDNYRKAILRGDWPAAYTHVLEMIANNECEEADKALLHLREEAQRKSATPLWKHLWGKLKRKPVPLLTPNSDPVARILAVEAHNGDK